VINITNLYKNFGDLEVLKNISTEIKKGEIISIIGPSGSGKSTFLRCINKLEEPSLGHIYIDGMDLMDKNTDINKVRERVGMVFQHFNLFPNMTVLDNLTLSPIMVKKESKEEAEKYLAYLKAKAVIKEDTKGFKPDWTDKKTRKYYGYWDFERGFKNYFEGGKPSWDSLQTTKESNIYFESWEDIEESFEKHPDEWKTYLTYEQ